MKKRIHKFQRQKFEYKKQVGRRLIDQEYNGQRRIICMRWLTSRPCTMHIYCLDNFCFLYSIWPP